MIFKSDLMWTSWKCFVFVLTDAIILNSLCKMFGLLDSVKQALDLKRSQDEENKIHNDDYGEKAARSTCSDIPVDCMN